MAPAPVIKPEGWEEGSHLPAQASPVVMDRVRVVAPDVPALTPDYSRFHHTAKGRPRSVVLQKTGLVVAQEDIATATASGYTPHTASGYMPHRCLSHLNWNGPNACHWHQGLAAWSPLALLLLHFQSL